MTSWTMWVLLAVVCTATLLDAMAVSERERSDSGSRRDATAASLDAEESREDASVDQLPYELEFRRKRSAEENKESPAAAVAENTDENKPVNGTDDATQPRARRDAGAGTPADAPGSPDQQRRLETTPEHQRVARQASDEGDGAQGPRAPWITDRRFLTSPFSSQGDGPSSRALARNSRDTKKGSDEKEQDKKEGEESKKNGTETEKKSDGKQ